jgi:hypothetical protein
MYLDSVFENLSGQIADLGENCGVVVATACRIAGVSQVDVLGMIGLNGYSQVLPLVESGRLPVHPEWVRRIVARIHEDYDERMQEAASQ